MYIDMNISIKLHITHFSPRHCTFQIRITYIFMKKKTNIIPYIMLSQFYSQLMSTVAHVCKEKLKGPPAVLFY
jgi:hypothetical protein